MIRHGAPETFYSDVSRPGTLGGLNKLRHHTRKKTSFLKKKLENINAYTLHRPTKKKFKRRSYISPGIQVHYAADLLDVSNIRKSNGNIRFILTIIDLFSRFAFTFPLKTKSADEVTEGFKTLFKKGYIPRFIVTDRGLEFINGKVQNLFKSYNIKHYFTHNYTYKVSVIERFNRTLSQKLRRYLTSKGTSRYIDVLDDLTDSYNRTYHRSINRSPASVTKYNQFKVHYSLHSQQPFEAIPSRFALDDLVKISLTKKNI